MDTVHNPTSSFSSRRPAASSLPAFSLPPPQPEVPSVDDHSSRPRTFYNIHRSIDLTPPSSGASEGLSPSLSSVHTSSSQGSQAPATMQQYTYGGHVHGSWPTPSGSSYGVSSSASGQPGASPYAVNPANGAQHPLGSSPYGGRSSMYGQPGIPYGNQRSPQSPAAGGDSLPAPPYDHHSFSSSNGHDNHAGGLSSGNMLPSHAAQAPAPSAASAHVDSYTHGRSSVSGPSYAPSPASQHQPGFPYAAQPSPTNHSPAGAASLPRGLGPLPSQPSLPSMAHPGSYRPPYAAYQPLPTMGGPVMSNIHQPGSQLSMIPGMVAAGYGAPAMMYPHPQPQPQSERPFKCDQCVQSFSRNHDLKRHKRIHLAVKPFPCTYCSKSFSRKDALKRHRLVKGCENKSNENQSGAADNAAANDPSPK
ncbi:hypothetical protein Trco_004775 [Trichoderma cornu-damae]|uniref:C2H2-type domain-containing protein n=1 Tax=Trichoderma cornu-damae TaxID=654480 RepID=A0A9P8QNI4_9HYPO|nr:hypothetical protein Trco_004775 [Trichoderma cornu-damae]